MNTHTQTHSRICSGELSEAQTTGAGCGLTSISDAFASAGLHPSVLVNTLTGAGHVWGVEAVTVADALASREPATTPLLRACQVEQDRRIVERSAYKLRARMQGDGKVIGDDAFREAQQSAMAALTLWRSGVTTARHDGADTLTAADASTLERHAARVAWRALVRFLSDDGIGNTIQIHGGAEDDWLCAQALPSESRRERVARLWIERHAGNRQALLQRRLAHVGGGRGRRAASLGKVGQALLLMLAGDTLDTAAAAVGFKPRGRHPAGDSLLRACHSLGLTADGFTLPRRSR